jgi:MFS family permease
MGRSVSGLLVAKALSDVGFALDFVCLSIFVWLRTQSVLATGLVSLALYVGGVLGGRLGHRHGARWDRRRAMVGADCVRMAALLGLAVVPDGAQVWVLFPAVCAVGAGRAVFEATLAAATPVLAPGRVQLLNSVLSGLKGVSMVAGMGLAAVAVPVVGFRGVFVLDALSYGVSAVAVLMLPLRLREPSAPGHPQPGQHRMVGWPAMVGAGVVLLVAVRGLDALGSASHHVALPILGDLRDPANPAGVTGVVWMTWAAGTVLGSLVLRPVLRAVIDRAPGLVFCAATAGMSVGFIGIFWLPGWPWMLTAAIVAGLGDALSEITFKQSLQQLPDQRRGVVFGLSQVVINSGFVVGLAVTSVALTPAGAGGWVLLLHGIPCIVAVAVGLWLLRAARSPAVRPAGGGR